MKKYYTNEEQMVDRLGELRAEIKALADEAEVIETWLKASGVGKYDGEKYSVSVSVYEKTTIAWKAIAEKLKASDYMKKAYSKVSTVCTLKLTAHKKEIA